MKHIFYVHSNICLLITINIINDYQIEKKDVIIISARGFTPFNITELKCINIDNFIKIGVLRWNIFQSLYECFQFDKKIKKEIEDDCFYAYIPQTTIPVAELLITNKYCKGFYYIEEGSASYQDPNDLNLLFSKSLPLTKRIKLLGWLNRIYTHKFFELDKSIAVFCTDIKAFPYTNNKFVLENVFKCSNTKTAISENKLYCVFDGISSYYEKYRAIHIISFLRGVKELLSRNDYKEIIIKFHPNQFLTGENILFEKILRTEIELISKIHILDKDYMFEILIVENKNLDIIVLSSSLGIYAQKLGHNIFTFYNFFEELSSTIEINDPYIIYLKKITNKFNQTQLKTN